MSAQPSPGRHLLRLVLFVLVALSGLCTIFALVTTAAEAWQERAQKQWPQATAHVDTCELARTSYDRREMQHIDCRLSFVVNDRRIVADIYSANVPSPEVLQYPPNQIQPYLDWVNYHPAGSTLAVRYDPSNPQKVVLASDYMPRGGPHTTNNLKLVAACAGTFVVSFLLARIMRPQRDREPNLVLGR